MFILRPSPVDMSNSSTLVIKKAQELRQNFRSAYRPKYFPRDKLENLSLKSYEFSHLSPAMSPHVPKKSAKTMKSYLNAKEKFLKSPTVRKYLRYKLFSLPNAERFSIRYEAQEDNQDAQEFKVVQPSQNIIRRKLKIKLPVCEPASRGNTTCKSSGRINFYLNK